MLTYEFGEDIGPMYMTINVQYDVYPGEPMVMYYPNGDGYPGSPPELDVLDVVVTSVSGETYDKSRRELIDLGWANLLDKIAEDYVEEHITGWLGEDMLENAS